MSSEILYESIIIKTKDNEYLPLLLSGSSNAYEAYNERKRERVLRFNFFLPPDTILYTKDNLKQAFQTLHLGAIEEDTYVIRHMTGRRGIKYIKNFLLNSLKYPIDIDKLQEIQHPLTIQIIRKRDMYIVHQIIVTSENIEKLSPFFTKYYTKNYYIEIKIKGIQDEKEYRKYIKQRIYEIQHKEVKNMTDNNNELEEKLKTKLREIFQFENQNLNFEKDIIGSIKKQLQLVNEKKRKEINSKLKKIISREEVEKYIEALNKGDEKRIKIYREDFRKQIEEYESLKKQLDKIKISEDLEREIYNHLINFFSRYYNNGDFINKKKDDKNEEHNKNLKEFLRRELDFYIKNEILNLSDLNILEKNDCFNKLKLYLIKAKIFRNIALKIIEFLTQMLPQKYENDMSKVY